MTTPLEWARDGFLALFDAAEAGRPDDEPAFLRHLRLEARDAFAAAGLPSTRLEEWRYTNVTPIASVPFELPPRDPTPLAREELEAASSPVFACSLYVFVNGRFVPGLSSPRAVSAERRLESLGQLAREEPARLEVLLARSGVPKEHPFAALNASFLEDGAVVTIPRGSEAPRPIHLVFVTSAKAPCAVHPRVIVSAEAGSRALVIQDHVSLPSASGPARLTNVFTDVRVGPGASLDLVLLQREDSRTHHVSLLRTHLERDARLTTHTLSLGGALLRNDLEAILADEGADCTLYGLFLGAGNDVVDNHTRVDHAMPHGRSRQLYKGILTGRSRGVFRGRILVRPGAVGTNAEQSNPNLLLDDGAEIDSKPQLEIYAGDVRCTHGSSIGRIEPESLFYLRSRGIAERDARALLTRGFARQVLMALPHEGLRDALDEILAERLFSAETGS
jgi:Fe-S cluster assembly protein SufD